MIVSWFPQAELDAVLQKMNSDKVEYKQKLERQAQLLDTKTAKIKKLEGQNMKNSERQTAPLMDSYE